MVINILLSIFIFLLGLVVGSFLNCVIYRLEAGKSLKGRSFCPQCGHKLSWLDLFPVFSFLFLAGKCRHCGKKISTQYPLVELAGGIIFLLIFSAQSEILSAGQFLNLIFLLYIASVLIVIFVYDLKHYIIPDKVLLPAIAIALIFNFQDILAGLVAACFFLAIFLISQGRWMGFGDVKLAFLMGLLLGIGNVVTALFLAFFFGAIISIILIGFYGKNLKSEIPFGPFLILGTFLALLYGKEIISWYTSFF